MKKKISDSGKSKYILIAVTILCCIMIFLTFTTDMHAGTVKVRDRIRHYPHSERNQRSGHLDFRKRRFIFRILPV